jgi:rubrerythrin
MPSKKVSSGGKLSPLANGIVQAMQAEIEGYEFYRLISIKSKDKGAKEMFASLAKDEAEHHVWLADLYGKLVEDPAAKTPKMPAKTKYSFKSPIFSKDFLASRKAKNLEMSALSIGILLETNAIDHYRKQAGLAKDPSVKKFFEDLARWEGDHLRALIAQKQFLMRDIFDAARFEPF